MKWAWLVLACAGGSHAAEPAEISGRAMGTTWSVKYHATAAIGEAELKTRIAARLEELERMFSTYRRDSEVTRFNASGVAEQWIVVSAEIATVAAACHDVSERTGGAFDVTVAPLLALWGFGPGGVPVRAPRAEDVAAARARVDFRRLHVRTEPAALRKSHAGVAVDFSSMAKGFAADDVGTRLTAWGVSDSLVRIGGDLKSNGRAKWRVGIEDADTGEIAGVVTLTGARGLSTSSNRRNVVELGGRRRGHIVDPRTGEPANSAVASVSVMAESCARSSAWATALMVLGEREGATMAEHEGLAAWWQIATERGLRPRESVRWGTDVAR